jgi:chromosome segregation ATPase
MKHLGILLAGALTLLVVFTAGIFSFLPQEAPAQPAVVVSAAPTTAEVQVNVAEREAAYQAQITKLNQTLGERQATYQTQMQELNTQIAAVQKQLSELKALEQNLLGQAAQLETTRAERLATYQSQLEQVQSQYNARYTQLQTQLTEAQTKLAEANTQLGR